MSKTIISSRSTSTSNTLNLETKIYNLIPKEDITLKWVKNILVNTISIENANTICDYVIAMRSEANISLSTIRNLIYTLTRFIRKFEDRSFRDIKDLDIKLYLNSLRKPEDEDPTQRWIGSQNYIVSTLQKFLDPRGSTFQQVSKFPSSLSQMPLNIRKPSAF
jgi:Phage integrase, N-terminal SAM-like domain